MSSKPATGRIGFITDESHPQGTVEYQLAVPHLERLGFSVRPVIWSDQSVDWSVFTALVMRSPWDYHVRMDEFVVWLDDLHKSGVLAINGLEVIHWNANKNYLRELQQRGASVIPTVWATRGRMIDLEHVLSSNGWLKAVVKPAIGATSHQTWITDASSGRRDQAKLSAMMQAGDALIQPFIKEIIRDGELALVFFHKQYSHAMLKLPRPGDFRVQSTHGGSTRPVVPTDQIIKQAAAIIDLVQFPTTYARVDGVVQNGKFMLMELELFEPDLGLGEAPGAASRFAAAIAHTSIAHHENHPVLSTSARAALNATS